MARLSNKQMSVTAGSSFGHKRSGSMQPFSDAQSKFGGSLYSTPFVLDKDRSNKHKVVEDVQRSMETSTQIPFLRSQVDPRTFSRTHHGTFMG